MQSTISHTSLPVRVLKFGGSSVGTPEAIRRVVRIVRASSLKTRPLVVVSALSEVTNTLESLLGNRSDDRTSLLLGLYRRHVRTAEELLSAASLSSYREILGRELSAIVPALRRISRGIGTLLDSEIILAGGERFSVPLISAALREAQLNSEPVDATRLVRVRNLSDRDVDTHETTIRIREWFEELSSDVVPVVTGFIGATDTGHTVTLGRGGSDFTAALIAGSLSADLMERWTDVDGLYSEDPNRSDSARKYDVLCMEDAEILNSASGLGMHRHTIAPLLATRTPLRVRSLSEGGSGTLVLPANRRSTTGRLSC